MSRTCVHLDGDATAARQARAFVREVVGDEPELDDLLLVTSELVTNAVMHAGTASDLEVRLTPDEVEVRLSDATRASRAAGPCWATSRARAAGSPC